VIHHVVHVTEYLYSERVSTSHHDLHLLPRATPEQTCLGEELEIAPAPATRRERTDDFGNRCTYVEIHEPHNNLRVTSRADVEVAPPAPLPATSVPWESVRDVVRAGAGAEARAARAFAFSSPYVPASTWAVAREYALPSFAAGRPVVEAARALTSRLHADFAYDSRATTIATPVDEVLRLRRGVCQDFAHLQIACLRTMGLAARYVSGYIVTEPPPGEPRQIGADASHAWLSAFVPGAGWLDVDPTQGRAVGEGHITVAWARDYEDVAPLKGILLGGRQQSLRVAVDVVPLSDGEVSPT
jgi:transglutaminase-like putative cysteine protease